ncbi:alpha/beta fold hydrolase [Mycolicibacterium sp. BiH015]|uniref:alpha/beta fold hydrolase n=1 Tax=Mycolicibacterium sp. BiH015 TaxID=3018808 RepID=UPI0022DEBB5F|nr:alpha/beta fold hydrolase [Mycolicibacterium sp. BiH015]MDA2893314.1 alpha/beta fold hydrolase [Mycolicibacterium sp. BiH015]
MSPSPIPAAPLVLIHGIGETHRSWDDVVSLLGDITVIRYDLRGHGNAPTRPPVTSIDDFVDDLVDLFCARGLDIAHVVGFSLGGLIAQRFAVREPFRVATLIVIGTVAGRTDVEVDAARRRLRTVETFGPRGVAEESIRRWFTPQYLSAHPDVADQIIEQLAAVDPIAYAAAYRVLASTDLADDLPSITAPTLAITGELDEGSPPHMCDLIAQATGGHAVIVPGVKHDILREQPDRIAKEILTHVGRDQF